MTHPLILLGDLAPVDLTVSPRLTVPAHWPDALIVANLETPLCPASLPAQPKAGPTIRGTPDFLRGFTDWRRLVLVHANNHAMDYGLRGLEATRTAAHAASIPLIGAGLNLTAASATHELVYDNLKVTVLSVSEPWFGLATATTAGVHAWEPGLYAQLGRLKAHTDRLIVSIHGGSEMSPWPSPRWQAVLRAMITAGADVVHAHHPHIPQGWERYAQGWIFYGLGNTLINPLHWPLEATRRSWSAQLDLADLTKPPQIHAWECTTVGDPDSDQLELRSTPTPDTNCFSAHNSPLGDHSLLTGLHQEYALHLWHTFYSRYVPLGDSFRSKLRLTARSLRDTALASVMPRRWQQRHRDRTLFYYHLFRAPGHADEIATALGLLGGETADYRNDTTKRMAQLWLPVEPLGR